MSSRPVARAGFTLIELLVALTLAALIALTARSIVDGVYVSVAALQREKNAYGGARNIDRHLRSLAAAAVVDGHHSLRFRGTSDSVSFATMCDTPEARLVRCRVSLAIRAAAPHELLLRLPRQPGVTVREGDRALGFRYLSSAEDGGRWTDTWESTAFCPLAIGVLYPADTLVLRIGARG